MPVSIWTHGFFFFFTWISEILTIDWKDLEAVAVTQQLASPVPKLWSLISFYLPLKGTEVFLGGNDWFQE